MLYRAGFTFFIRVHFILLLKYSVVTEMNNNKSIAPLITFDLLLMVDIYIIMFIYIHFQLQLRIQILPLKKRLSWLWIVW